MTGSPPDPERSRTKAEILRIPLSDPDLRQDLEGLTRDTRDDLKAIPPDLPRHASPDYSGAPKDKASHRNLRGAREAGR